MVCNDLAIANSSLGHFKKLPDALNHVRQGALVYFVKMSCAHLREGMRAIAEVRDSPALADLVKRCDAHAQSAFAELRECLPGGGTTLNSNATSYQFATLSPLTTIQTK